MKLEELPTKELLALHNRIADKPAGPKTFATRTKLVARIEQVAEAKNIDLSSFGQPKKPKANAPRAEPKAEATEAPEVTKTIDLIPDTATEKAPRGKGVGALARQLLMDPAGTPHADIAAEVNRRITGAQATAKSVRWYANQMRKQGIEVPPRQRSTATDGIVEEGDTAA
jgi:hypothetical protein